MDNRWIEDRCGQVISWLDVTYTGLFNTEAIKCKHQDIQQGSSLVYLDTEHHVEIELKLEWFAKDKKHLLNVFLLQLW